MGPETKNDCACEGPQQFTGLDWWQPVESQSEAEVWDYKKSWVFRYFVSSRYLTTTGKQTKHFVCAPYL
jgi:hypothetical protein